MCLERCGSEHFDCDKGFDCIQYKETRNAMAKVCTNCAGNKGKTCFRCSCSTLVPAEPVPAVEAASKPAPTATGALVPVPCLVLWCLRKLMVMITVFRQVKLHVRLSFKILL